MKAGKFDPAIVKVLLYLIGDNHEGFNAAASESFLQLSIPAIDPKQNGTQYRAEAERKARLQTNTESQV
jgi:hypothetical protein